jgi:hypothetical protein
MADSQCELRHLLAAADMAYQHARMAVFDELRPEEFTDASMLTPYQQEALDMLADAEAALREYRERCYISLVPDVPLQWSR